MRLYLHPLELILRKPFRISRGTKSHQASLVVELRHNGHRGWGEAAALAFFGAEVKAMMAELASLREAIEAEPLVEPETFWQKMQPLIVQQPFALAALDIAYQDLWARLQGKTVMESWGLKPANLPLTNITLGIDPIPSLVEQVQQLDWPVYKVKLGGGKDIETIRALREVTDAPFRIDANCAWTAEECLAKAPELKALRVEFIEQPLALDDWEGMKKLYAHSPLPIIADESCLVEADVEKCRGYFHGINIKLAKCGGLSPARRMLMRAKELDMLTMCGCMIESNVGIAAIAQLLPLLDFVDMDGALGLKYAYASGVTIKKGKVYFPDDKGTGAKLNEEFQNQEIYADE